MCKSESPQPNIWLCHPQMVMDHLYCHGGIFVELFLKSESTLTKPLRNLYLFF